MIGSVVSWCAGQQKRRDILALGTIADMPLATSIYKQKKKGVDEVERIPGGGKPEVEGE